MPHTVQHAPLEMERSLFKATHLDHQMPAAGVSTSWLLRTPVTRHRDLIAGRANRSVLLVTKPVPPVIDRCLAEADMEFKCVDLSVEESPDLEVGQIQLHQYFEDVQK